jgi:transporter family protein
MNLNNFVIALFTLISWGVGSFTAKLATNRIGMKTVFWDMMGYFPTVVIYCLLVFKTKTFFNGDRLGIIFGILSGVIGSFGLIGFYTLLSKKEASTAVPMTAIYPALTAILAFIFLKEKLTIAKGIGIVLSTIALYLLSL